MDDETTRMFVIGSAIIVYVTLAGIAVASLIQFILNVALY